MGMNTIIKKGVLLSALALSVFCLFQARGGKNDIAKKSAMTNNGPAIINNEPVVYLDNTDQISVQGEGIQSVAYSSSNQKVAKINQKGKITPKKKGTTTIRAKVAYQAEGQNREASLSYTLKVLGKSKEYFIYLNNDPKYFFGESEIIGLTEAGKKLKDVYIPERYLGKKVKLIHRYAFADGSRMERLFISDYVEDMHNSSDEDYLDSKLPAYLDRGCNKLREIHLGKNVAHFGISDKLPRLEKITVASGNKTYHVQDGILFKGKETLTLYPAGKKNTSYAIPEGITEIADSAFAWAKNLKQVAIPSDIKELIDTFRHSGLTEVVLPEELVNCNSAFQNCADLKKVVIPALPNIIVMSRTFKDCTSLETVQMKRLPNCFNGENFMGCGSLEKIQLPQNIKGLTQKDNVIFDSSMETLLLYPAGKKDKHYNLPGGVKKIHDGAFAGAQHLTEVTLNKELQNIEGMAFSNANIEKIHFNAGLQKIGTLSFWNCNIKKAVLPDSVRILEAAAFESCKQLRSIRLSPNIEELNNTFLGCTSLRTLRIPQKTKKIYSGAGLNGSSNMSSNPEDGFIGCTSLASVTVEKGSKYFTAEKGVLYNKSKTTLIVYPAAKKDKKYSMPKSIKKVSYGAFAGCGNLRELTMKNRVTKCEWNAFFNMRSLRKIKLSNNLKKLESSAFSGCIRLQEICIPEKIKRINDCTFDGCTSLKSVILGKNVSQINAHAFRDCRNLQKIIFRKKIWNVITRPAKPCFERAGSKNYGKLALHVPKKWKKKKKLVLEWFHKAGLNRKAKIKFDR